MECPKILFKDKCDILEVGGVSKIGQVNVFHMGREMTLPCPHALHSS